MLTPDAYAHVVKDFFTIIQNSQPHAMQSFSQTKTSKSLSIEFQKWGYLLSFLRNITFIDMRTQVNFIISILLILLFLYYFLFLFLFFILLLII